MGELLQKNPFKTNKPSGFILVSPATYSRCHKMNIHYKIGKKTHKLKMVADIWTKVGVGYIFVNHEYVGPYLVEDIH